MAPTIATTPITPTLDLLAAATGTIDGLMGPTLELTGEAEAVPKGTVRTELIVVGALAALLVVWVGDWAGTITTLDGMLDGVAAGAEGLAAGTLTAGALLAGGATVEEPKTVTSTIVVEVVSIVVVSPVPAVAVTVVWTICVERMVSVAVGIEVVTAGVSVASGQGRVSVMVTTAVEVRAGQLVTEGPHSVTVIKVVLKAVTVVQEDTVLLTIG